MNIIPTQDERVLGDLAVVVLAGLNVTIQRARMEPECAWKIGDADSVAPTLYLNRDWSASALADRLPYAIDRLAGLIDQPVRPTLRVLPGVADPTAPVRPTLRVLPGGVR